MGISHTLSTSSSPADLKRYLSGSATREMDALRTALDARLVALEAALADPAQSASLERLVLDLARVATTEAQVAAARACLESQLKLQEQTVSLRDAEQSLDVERTAAASLRRDLDRLRSAFEAESGSVAQLRRDLAEAHAAAKRERDTVAQATGSIARLQQELAAVQSAATERIADLEEAADRFTADTDRLNAELEASRRAVTAADAGARARHESLRAEAEGRIRDLELELAAVQNAATTRIADLERAADRFTSESAGLKSDADRLGAERDRLAGDLEAIRQAAEAAEAEARARYDHARQEADRRVRDLELELDGRDREIRKRDERIAALDAEARALSAPPQAPEPAAGPPVEDRPLRRAQRVEFEDVEVLIDEGSAVLVNLSTCGAQVLSPRALKPNRVLRVQLAGGEHPVTCAGAVVWARLEPMQGSLMYRAGMAFIEADQSEVEEFLSKHGNEIRN